MCFGIIKKGEIVGINNVGFDKLPNTNQLSEPNSVPPSAPSAKMKLKELISFFEVDLIYLDNSLEEVSEQLVVMYHECLQGDFSSVEIILQANLGLARHLVRPNVVKDNSSLTDASRVFREGIDLVMENLWVRRVFIHHLCRSNPRQRMMVTKDLQGLLKWHIRGIGRSSLRVKKLIHAQPLVMKKSPEQYERGNGNVAIIDRDGTSGSDHIIVPTAERFGMDAGAVIDNIMDSIMAMFLVDFMGRGERQKLAQIFSRLTKTANYYNDAVYMTNQEYRPSEAKVYKICEAAKKIMRKAVISILTGTQSPYSLLGGECVKQGEQGMCLAK
ncbi:SNW domain-containing protein 1 [Orobanche minor]